MITRARVSISSTWRIGPFPLFTQMPLGGWPRAKLST